MPSSTAVLILGPMRAGKTTAATYLVEEYGFRKYALADKLKQLHHTVTGVLGKDREWLQTFGASCRSVFGEDFWAERLIEQISKESPDCFVVDDVRYENELAKLYAFARSKYSRVVVLLIAVPMDTQIERGAEIQLLQHVSESYSRVLLNAADYNKDTGVGWSTALKCLPIPIIDGETPLSLFYAEIEAEMDFARFDRLKRAYADIAKFNTEEWSIDSPLESVDGENVSG
jgi:hypothetical protein